MQSDVKGLQGGVLVLPFPAAGLMPNRANGQHWAVTRRLRDEAKQTAFCLAKQAGFGADVSGCLNVVFYCPDRRKRDADNLLAAMKSALDGVAQAMGRDDSEFASIRLEKRFDGAGRVELWFDGGGQ